MKNKILQAALYAFGIAISFLLPSCSSEPTPGGYTGFRQTYQYEITDTVLSADSHEFTLSMTGENQPHDWDLFEIKIWNGEDIPDTINNQNPDWRIPEVGETFCNDDKKGYRFGTDWITIEKVSSQTSPILILKITMEKNITNQARGIEFLFASGDGIPYWNSGRIFIIQKPMPEDI